jgi:hypothetical protein
VHNVFAYGQLRLPAWLGLCDGRQACLPGWGLAEAGCLYTLLGIVVFVVLLNHDNHSIKKM